MYVCMYEAAASCKDITRALVTNWEPQCVTLAGHCYAVRHGMKVQLVTPYCVSHLQHYGVTVRGNVASVYPPLNLLSNCRNAFRCRTSLCKCHVTVTDAHLYPEHMLSEDDICQTADSHTAVYTT